MDALRGLEVRERIGKVLLALAQPAQVVERVAFTQPVAHLSVDGQRLLKLQTGCAELALFQQGDADQPQDVPLDRFQLGCTGGRQRSLEFGQCRLIVPAPVERSAPLQIPPGFDRVVAKFFRKLDG